MKKLLLLAGAFLILASELFLAQTVSVTFQVDMTVQQRRGAFDPATHQVNVRGNFEGWSTNTPMTDDDSDMIYTVTVDTIAANSALAYKFFHSGNDTWESDPNREFDVGADNVVLDVALFDRESLPSGDLAPVTFQVNLQKPIQDGDFNPGSDFAFVFGNFTGGTDGAIELTNTGNDTLFATTVEINSDSLLLFRFAYSSNNQIDDNATLESEPDRMHYVVDGENSVSDFWDGIDPNIQTGSGTYTFTVDMSVMAELGLFNPSEDSVQIRGAFNGWGDSNPDVSLMNQDFLNTDQWFIDIPLEDYIIGDPISYKYFANVINPDSWTETWEKPAPAGGGNRELIFEDGDKFLDVHYFDGIHPDWVINDGQNLEVTFSVDMEPALSNATPFNPETDTVKWVGGTGTWLINQNGSSVDSPVFILERVGETNIFEGTYTIQEPSYNTFVYVYQYIHVDGDNATEVTEDRGGSGERFVYRTRYIGQDAPRSFPTNPWNMPLDTWTNEKVKVQEIDPFSSLTDVRELDIIPEVYSLEQNYPNPFNPATVIRFSIPKADNVKLEIYNLLGQKVKTLINEELRSGTHEVDFNTSGLSSGVYFYSINAGTFQSTRKMLLLK